MESGSGAEPEVAQQELIDRIELRIKQLEQASSDKK